MNETATGLRFRQRPVVAGDGAFLLTLEADRWGVDPGDPLAALQSRARSEGYRTQFPEAEDSLVVVGDDPAGRLLVARRPAAHHVVDIALLRRYRGRGIGTTLMAGVLADAGAAGASVELTVVAGDARLLGWYERLGFVAVSGDGLHAHLARSPARAG